MRSPRHHRYTWKQYLTLEEDSPIKHEFFDGEIYAMAGGTPAHAALALAVGAEIRAQLKGGQCRAYSSDLRIRVVATGLGTYPDVSVVCGSPEHLPNDPHSLINPVVIVEVLSDSTEEYDRGGKFENYRQVETLREYVLVSHREQLIEVFRRGEGGEWSRTEARTNVHADLESIGCRLDVDAIYAGIELHTSG